ncbi:polar tube protein 1 [Encephalitozoon cuniculi EcunIII-L]|nr:polar tube protein 1 [Encephalitozoon cuniculi EcunIII-L]
MKGISKILSASIALMKLENVYSATALCSNAYGLTPGQQGMAQQPSYVLIPSTPGTIANCASGSQDTYSPSPAAPTSPVTPGKTSENETSPSAPAEDVGTCKIAVLKHCDAPGTTSGTTPGSGPCETPEQQRPLSVISTTPAVPVTVESAQFPSVVPVVPVVAHHQAVPGYYNNGTSGIPGQQQILSGTLPPGATLCQGQAMSSTPGQQQVLSGTLPPGVTLCQGQATPSTPGQQQVLSGTLPPGVTLCQGQATPSTPGQQQVLSGTLLPGATLCQDQGMPGTSGVPGQQGQSSGQCCAPQIPNPVMPPSMNISGNGYPSSTAYSPNLGSLGSCVDIQKTGGTSCEQKPEKSATQYAMEACATPTPTVIIGNSEYLVGPGMYNAINSPCNTAVQCC